MLQKIPQSNDSANFIRNFNAHAIGEVIALPARAIDAFAELDNFARQKFDGENPLAKHPAWTVLLRCAKDDPGTQCRPEPSMFVGEDSNFCDRAKFLGFKIVVLTDVACGHVDRKVITAEDHKTEMRRSDRLRRLAVGGTR